ncbi:putative D-glycerate permease [Neolewinella xylanilytica]|uniref:Putative D-glycerate permease n=1 Tax=Neolewinella xylanilytica TaxID=1514080 RepID=A0A2S6I1Q4_9BACT|nr:GntP family permease [Neolewinella xylanilytica]PPK84803.1 putative D-glycerate permease [Neolewinella xylanilytica]
MLTVFLLLLSVAMIILLTARLEVHPFVALMLVAIGYGMLVGMPLDAVVASVNAGFGNTLGGIGLIIILGVIIGAFLENTGAAYTLADRVLRLAGKDRVTVAMGLIGWVVSIPVFADSGFMLLSPLNRSLSKKAGLSLAGTAIALAMGLMAAHTMVPPTPGPIAAAFYLDADLGIVLLLGIPISLISLGACLIFIRRYVAKTYIDPAPEITQAEIDARLTRAPGALLSSVPIFVPIVLIVVRSMLVAFGGFEADGYGDLPFAPRVVFFLGEPFIALTIGCLLSLLLPKKLEREMFSTDGWIGKALTGAASILLITGAGGVFGQILRDSGIANVLGDALAGLSLNIWLPFILAAAIKSAQGSSTVALITTASIMAPMLDDLGFTEGIDRALVVVAIGAGSAVVSHANDSFFWVVTRLSGMDVKMGYRFMSLSSFVLGITAALSVFIVYLLAG